MQLHYRGRGEMVFTGLPRKICALDTRDLGSSNLHPWLAAARQLWERLVRRPRRTVPKRHQGARAG